MAHQDLGVRAGSRRSVAARRPLRDEQTSKVGATAQAVPHELGREHDGLRFRTKGQRWVVVATGETFREPDERLAVARFHKLVRARATSTLGKLVVHSDAEAAMLDALGRTVDAGGALDVTFQRPNGRDAKVWAVVDETLSTKQWAWLRKQLLKRPQWVAEQVGIEQVGYLQNLKPRTPSPRLSDVGKLYTGRQDIGQKETQKCATTWADFARSVGVVSLRELTPGLVAKWSASVKRRGLSAKTTHHVFNRVKTILNHYRTTGVAIDDVRHAIDCCAVLKAPDTTSLDPHPIGRADFSKLLEKAEDEGRAILLVALNLCFYPIDVVRLRWDQLDLERGVYHARRGKTRVARAGVLWSRTIESLTAIARADDDYVFHRANGLPHTATTVRKWFWDLRETAGVAKEVQFADIRDGSFTEAAAGDGVEFQHARVLAGHRSGIADAYVLRNPKMVAKACAAVEAAYFD